MAICPKKEVELGADRLIHRALHAEELKQEIEFPCSKAVSNQYALMCGGALRAINPNSSMTMAEMETCAAVFKGNLFNKADLALQLVGCPPQLNEAQLLLHLYAAKGLDMLGMLQGQYAFCLYDSKQARVFAARDHSGAVPLLEGRTAAGSLIIACGTFLPEGVHQMVDIQPGQYKYGWHALPRDFKCGTTKIVSGRASCEYGIRRRSIDAFNASPSTPSTRGKSLDIPGKHHSHGTGSTTPGRYVPPHSAGGFYSRQRATSLDSGHWGSHHHVSASMPSPQAGHNFGGRRRTSENNGHNSGAAAHGSGAHASKEHNSPRQQQQQQHHAAKPAPSPSAAPAAPAAHTPAAAAKAAAAALAAAAAATSALSPAAAPPASSSKQGASAPLHVAIPAAAAGNALSPGSDVSGAGAAGSEASTPMSGGADMASPHRRRRRHRSRKHKANGSTADGSVDAAGASSDTESQISTSTHDSANSAPTAAAAAAGSPAAPAAAAAGGGKPKSSPVAVPAGGRHRSEAGSTGKAGHQGKPAAAHSAGAAHEKPHRRSHQPNKQHHQQPQQQWQPKAKQQPQAVPGATEQRRSSSGNGSEFKRNGSCGELAALGSSPTPRPVPQVAPQGLAC